MKKSLILICLFAVTAAFGQLQQKNKSLRARPEPQQNQLFAFPTVIDSSQLTDLNFKSIKITPTPAFLRLPNKGEARMARLELIGGVCKEPCEIELTFNGHKMTNKLDLSGSPVNLIELALPGKDISVSTQLFVKLKCQRNNYTASAIVNPTRRWCVYLTPHSHVDVGYTDLQENVAKMHCNVINDAISLAEKTANYPKEARYVQNVEVMWPLDEYLKIADNQQKERLWNAVKKGWITFGNSFLHINTSNISSEGLLHNFYMGNKVAKEKNISPEFIYQGDIPGASWGISGLSNATNLKYFLAGPNPEGRVGSIRKEWEDRPFYWLAPDGRSKILYYQCYPYNIGNILKGRKFPKPMAVVESKEYITGDPYKYFLDPALFPLLDIIEAKKLPYDITVLTWSMRDNCPIDPELPDAVVMWNKKYSSPLLIISSMHDFMTDFEQKYKDIIPQVKGDLTEYWTDGTATTAHETSIYRCTTERIQQAEVLSLMNQNKQAGSSEKFTEAWRNILLYAEHTWGAHNSVIAPDLDFVKNIWNKKQSYVLDANREVNQLIEGLANSTINREFKVINTTTFVQNQLVRLSSLQSGNFNLVYDDHGKNIPSQRLSTGELVFVAREIAPFSAVKYTLGKGKISDKATLKCTEREIENDFYKIAVDSKTGNIASIYSKILGQEMVNKKDSLQFNQFIYLTGKNNDKNEFRKNNYYLINEYHKKDKVSYSSNPRIKIKEAGTVIVTLEIEFDAPSCKTLISEISLIDGIDNISICNTLDKLFVRDKEAVHFAFPFLVTDPCLTYDIPTGYARVNSEQIPGSCKNWYTIQRWLDISNNNYGVVFSSKNAALFELGAVTANLYGSQSDSPLWIKESPVTSTILSWALNNHWFTNFKADQGGIISFQYDFAAHKGNELKPANKFGICNVQPLIIASKDNSYRDIDLRFENEDVYISHIKPSADGNAHILSVSNMSETDILTRLKGLHSTSKIYNTNLNEEKLKECTNPISLPGRAFSLYRVELR